MLQIPIYVMADVLHDVVSWYFIPYGHDKHTAHCIAQKAMYLLIVQLKLVDPSLQCVSKRFYHPAK